MIPPRSRMSGAEERETVRTDPEAVSASLLFIRAISSGREERTGAGGRCLRSVSAGIRDHNIYLL